MQEAIPVGPVGPELGPDGLPIDEAPVDDTGGEENVAQRIWRFILGLFGLGSESGGDEQPVEQAPYEYQEPVLP